MQPHCRGPYFVHNDSIKQRNRRPEVSVRNFHLSVKSMLFRATGTTGRLLDLAAGRGGDCSRYAQFREVYAVDNDPTALRELSRRCQHAQLHVVVRDMMQPLSDLDVFDAVSLMFGVHYACQSLASLRMLASNVSQALRTGGLFVGLALDGDAVRDSLGDKGKRTYMDWATLDLSDNVLNVTIASISPTPKQEWLVMWDTLKQIMQDHGLVVHKTAMLEPAGFVQNAELQEFSRLHRYWMFQKM